VLDNKILTLSSSSACGIPDLKEGKEYLLAGTMSAANPTKKPGKKIAGKKPAFLPLFLLDSRHSAGTYANGNEMRIINCLLFIFQNQSGSTGSFKWEDVPSDLITKLKSGDFD
jgi:hypothetical protein